MRFSGCGRHSIGEVVILTEPRLPCRYLTPNVNSRMPRKCHVLFDTVIIIVIHAFLPILTCAGSSGTGQSPLPPSPSQSCILSRPLGGRVTRVSLSFGCHKSTFRPLRKQRVTTSAMHALLQWLGGPIEPILGLILELGTLSYT